MIHPSTKLVHINDEVGYGVVATDFIPVGTITYVKDDMEIVLEESHRLHLDDRYKDVIEKYSYTEADGSKVLSWDIAKYVNHSCNCNTLSTGYGFEIAIRDIHPGEQVTDDYGMFHIESEMVCLCGADSCRQIIGRNEFLENSVDWDNLARKALSCFEKVSQPLIDFLGKEILMDLKRYLINNNHYRSVTNLQLNNLQDVAV